MLGKRCSIGKSCGATCISKLDDCLIELGISTSESLSRFLSKAKDLAGRAISLPSKLNPKSASTPPESGSGSGAKEFDPNVFDSTFQVKTSIPGSKSTFNWKESITKGFEIGAGQYGSVNLVEGRNPYVVKRGEISTTEADIIRKVGAAGIGPKLLYAEIGKGRGKSEYGKRLVPGRIAMSQVAGDDFLMFDRHSDKVGKTTIGNAFWYLRSQLHRLGIAHNDAHIGNVLIDKAGKARFIDFGLAQENRKAALLEALGVFAMARFLPSKFSGAFTWTGDWQAKAAPNYGLKELRNGKSAPENLVTMRNNLERVYDRLRASGFSDKEITQLVTSKIRMSDSGFGKGAWGKVSDDLAMELINTLYSGVKDFS